MTPDGPAGPRGGRAIPRARLDKLFVDDRHGLRERVLWRMLYETAARAEELLSLNVEDLDLVFRRMSRDDQRAVVEAIATALGWPRPTTAGPGTPVPASCRPGTTSR